MLPNPNSEIIIVGGGEIAKQYAKTLDRLNLKYSFVVRSDKTAQSLRGEFRENQVYQNGIENLNFIPNDVIIATQVEYLYPITELLVRKGVRRILVEKPLTFSSKELNSLDLSSKMNNTQITIAFNRIHYPSVLTLKDYIENEGGIRTLTCDFSEALWKVNQANYHSNTLKNWIIANSSHAISTALHLIGIPEFLYVLNDGIEPEGLNSNGRYLSCGYTRDKAALVTFKADWGSAGSWGIELTTMKSKFILSPLEVLWRQELGSFDKNKVNLLYHEPEQLKPGFYNQLKFWISDNLENTISLADYQNHLKFYQKLEYPSQ